MLFGCALEPSSPDDLDPEKGDLFGTDDRKEYYQIGSAAQRANARGTAAEFNIEELEYDAEHDTYSSKRRQTLRETENLCPSQKFGDQPRASRCSATLIAKDVVLTAAHCIDSGRAPAPSCDQATFVFDYGYRSAPSNPLAIVDNIPAAKVYRCAKVLAREYDFRSLAGQDYAIVMLDRPVADREPVRTNWDGSPELGSRLYMLGFPHGIPEKLAPGTVKRLVANGVRLEAGEGNDDWIGHDADAFGGTSGGGVYDDEDRLTGEHTQSQGFGFVQREVGGCKSYPRCGIDYLCSHWSGAMSLRGIKRRLPAALRRRIGIPE